jgi:hypothetical protein
MMSPHDFDKVHFGVFSINIHNHYLLYKVLNVGWEELSPQNIFSNFFLNQKKEERKQTNKQTKEHFSTNKYLILGLKNQSFTLITLFLCI